MLRVARPRSLTCGSAMRLSRVRPRPGLGVLGVVGAQVLAGEGQLHRPVALRLQQEDRARAAPFRAVGVVLLEDHVVQIAAVEFVVARYPHADDVMPERRVDVALDVAAGAAVLGDRAGAAEFGGETVQVGLARDDAVEPAQEARAEQGALRTAGDLDPLDIHQPQVRVGGVVVDRQVVEIGGDGGARATGVGPVGEAAQQQLVAAGAQVGRQDVELGPRPRRRRWRRWPAGHRRQRRSSRRRAGAGRGPAWWRSPAARRPPAAQDRPAPARPWPGRGSPRPPG